MSLFETKSNVAFMKAVEDGRRKRREMTGSTDLRLDWTGLQSIEIFLTRLDILLD